MTPWPKAVRLLVEMEDGSLYALCDRPKVVAISTVPQPGGPDRRPFQIAVPGRAVTVPGSEREHLVMDVDDSVRVGRVAT